MTAPAKTRITILGGGAGALSAAFGLTEIPGWADRFDITIYQLGWRLGGKGASGRNQAVANRIEEHGLHVWSGFYENAFRMMRTVYQDLNRPAGSPLATIDDAFKKHPYVSYEEFIDSNWIPWHVATVMNDQVPGVGPNNIPERPRDYVPLAIAWLIDRVRTFGSALQAQGREWLLPGAAGNLGTDGRPHLGVIARHLDRVLLRPGSPASGTLTSHLDTLLEPLLDALDTARRAQQQLVPLADEVVATALRFKLDLFESQFLLLNVLLDPLDPTTARRLRVIVNFALTLTRGLLFDPNLAVEFQGADDEDWRDWLRRFGATDETLQSPIVRGVYNYVFAFPGGDSTQPGRLAAGTGLSGILRLGLTSKGAVFYKMQAGMGDAVFAPLYEVLKRRGVQFRFFHRVLNLGLSEGNDQVATIQLGRQVTLEGADYNPLIDVGGLPCWPTKPLYDQLVEGQELIDGQVDLESWWSDWKDRETITLTQGKDFDTVILGLSIGSFGSICPELKAASVPFRQMCDNVQTVQTLATQWWLLPTASQLGWPPQAPPGWPLDGAARALLTAYAEPLDSWCDMGQVLAQEQWPTGQTPQVIAYGCGTLPDDTNPPVPPEPAFPLKMTEKVRAATLQWLTNQAARLWPNAFANGVPRWDLLADPAGGTGQQRFDAQYFRANVNPSDRYVQCLPGTTKYRLRADQSGFKNLYLAGDWVRTSINAGCVESAVMGGFQASRAIGGFPQDIPGDPAPAPAVAVASTEDGSTLPPFIESGGQLEMPQPYALEGVQMYAFALSADPAGLGALIDRQLNQPTGGKYNFKPFHLPGFDPVVFLSFHKIARNHSISPARNIGFMATEETALFVPVQRTEGGLSLPSLWTPYIIVSHPWALVSGREVFGVPKGLGSFQFPASGTEGVPFGVDTMTLETFSPDSEATLARLMEVVGPAPQDGADAFHPALRKARLAPSRGHSDGERSLFDLWDPFWNLSPTMIFPKQFRDVTSFQQACYQKVVEVPVRALSLPSLGSLGGTYTVRIYPFESHPIVADLGLAGTVSPGAPCELPVLAAFQFGFSFAMDNGREL